MPVPLYQPTSGSPLSVDTGFYGRLGDEVTRRTLVDQFVVPIRTGKAWPVPARHICRIVAMAGPQVGDLDLWHLHNPRERFWAARTKQLHRAHMRVFDRFWSCLPYLRPMATVIGDSINYGIDPDGAGCHDLLGTRCDPYVHKLLTGAEWELCCHSNLVRAVLPYRLHESDIHDVLNVFQVTGLTPGWASVFRQTVPRAAGRLLRILCRNRLALRPLRLSPWGYVRGDLGTAGRRPLGGLPPPRRRSLQRRAGAAPRLAPSTGVVVSGDPWDAAGGGLGTLGDLCSPWASHAPDEGVSHVLDPSEGSSKLIPIHEESNHQIVHLFRLGKA